MTTAPGTLNRPNQTKIKFFLEYFINNLPLRNVIIIEITILLDYITPPYFPAEGQ